MIVEVVEKRENMILGRGVCVCVCGMGVRNLGFEAPINTGCGSRTYLDLDREDNIENN